MRKVLSALALSLGMMAGGAQADQATADALRTAGVQLPPVLWQLIETQSWGQSDGLAFILAVLADWGMIDSRLAQQLCEAQGADDLQYFLQTQTQLTTQSQTPTETNEASKQ